jgi:D-aminoacyl-tRNA deacylase
VSRSGSAGLNGVIGLLQRVTDARVTVGDEIVGAIGPGLLVLLGVARRDSTAQADRLLERILAYRVFPDAAGRMNLSLLAVGGELLVVPQFTLVADTSGGTRAGFSSAASPTDGERLYEYFLGAARGRLSRVASGRFGAHMHVSLTNDGPVTFWLEAAPSRPA